MRERSCVAALGHEMTKSLSQSRSGSVLSQDLGSESYRKWSARAACMPAVPAYRTYHRPRVAPLTLTHVFSLKTRYFVAVKSQ